jgi:DNA-binding transcriptional LysR family regulator
VVTATPELAVTTVRALECLVKLVEAGSITEAGTRLHLSPSAVSHQLSSLERELGTAVVTGSARGVAPTAAGRAAAARARVAINAASSAGEAGRRIAAGKQGRLLISCTETIVEGHLTSVLRLWRATRPQVEIELLERSRTGDVTRDVQTGYASLGVSPCPPTPTAPLSTLADERVMVLAGPAHRLRHREYVTSSELAQEPLVVYDQLPDVLHSSNVTYRPCREHPPQHRVRSARTAANLTHVGIGVAVVPSSALHTSHREHARPLTALTPSSASTASATMQPPPPNTRRAKTSSAIQSWYRSAKPRTRCPDTSPMSSSSRTHGRPREAARVPSDRPD